MTPAHWLALLATIIGLPSLVVIIAALWAPKPRQHAREQHAESHGAGMICAVHGERFGIGEERHHA